MVCVGFLVIDCLLPAAVVKNIYPSSGHALGGYFVTFNGSGFSTDSWTYECIFKCGNSSVRALVQIDESTSTNQLRCMLSTWLFPPCMSTVSLLQDSSNVYSASTLTFKFFAGWAQLDPSLGKSAGGHRLSS